MKFAQDVILDTTDITTVQYSEPVVLDQIYGYAFQCVLTGTPNGALKLQASCEILTNGAQVPTVWTDVDGSSETVTAAGTVLYNADAQFYKYVRVVYTPVGGAGTLKVTYNAKG